MIRSFRSALSVEPSFGNDCPTGKNGWRGEAMNKDNIRTVLDCKNHVWVKGRVGETCTKCTMIRLPGAGIVSGGLPRYINDRDYSNLPHSEKKKIVEGFRHDWKLESAIHHLDEAVHHLTHVLKALPKSVGTKCGACDSIHYSDTEKMYHRWEGNISATITKAEKWANEISRHRKALSDESKNSDHNGRTSK